MQLIGCIFVLKYCCPMKIFYLAVKKRKNGIGILLCNSYTAYIQSFKLGSSGLWAVSIRPR